MNKTTWDACQKMQIAGPERLAQWTGVQPGNLHVKPRPRAVLMQVAREPYFGNRFLNLNVRLHPPPPRGSCENAGSGSASLGVGAQVPPVCQAPGHPGELALGRRVRSQVLRGSLIPGSELRPTEPEALGLAPASVLARPPRFGSLRATAEPRRSLKTRPCPQ